MVLLVTPGASRRLSLENRLNLDLRSVRTRIVFFLFLSNIVSRSQWPRFFLLLACLDRFETEIAF